jgi:hypothetical protein
LAAARDQAGRAVMQASGLRVGSQSARIGALRLGSAALRRQTALGGVSAGIPSIWRAWNNVKARSSGMYLVFVSSSCSAFCLGSDTSIRLKK